MKRILIVAAASMLAAGCSVNSTFVYKPGAATGTGRNLPVKLAVLPFVDGTENFTKRGGVLAPETLYYNLAKAGIGGTITALTPELWAKAFADEAAASGDFRSARFVYSESELSDEDFRVEGTVENATASGAWVNPSTFAIRLRAFRKSEKAPAWEKGVSRSWKDTPAELYAGCGMSIQCTLDRHHRKINQIMREMFDEARADLVRALAPLAGAAAPDAHVAETGPVDRSRPESVDETIDNILKGP